MPKSTVGIVLSNEMTREILLKLPAKDYIDSRNVDVRKCKVTLEFCGIKHMDMWKCDCWDEWQKGLYTVFQLKSARSASRVEATEEKLAELSKTIEQCNSELKSAQSEVDRLLEILKETENEKNEKDNQIKELQE